MKRFGGLYIPPTPYVFAAMYVDMRGLYDSCCRLVFLCRPVIVVGILHGLSRCMTSFLKQLLQRLVGWVLIIYADDV